MTQFITIAGQKQVGKDSCAKILKACLQSENVSFIFKDNTLQVEGCVRRPEEHYPTVYVVHFADALKKACHVIFGIPLEDMETEEGKQKLTKVLWPRKMDNQWIPSMEYIDYCHKHNHDITGGARYMTVREVLQFVGTELFRNQIDPDVWLNSIFLQPWKENDIVIIADARFPNEAAVGRQNGLLINVQRDTGLISDGHKSENALADYSDYHHAVINNGTASDLHKKLIVILNVSKLLV